MRLKIADLLPNTDYVVQVRAIRDGKPSKWSEKFNFTSLDEDGTPAAPTTTWAASGSSFIGTWTPVTTDTGGNSIRVDSYELEFGDGTTTKILSMVAQTGTDLTCTMSRAANAALFGTPKPTITFRVRAVSNKKTKGTWSTIKSATNAAPATPTNFVATGIAEGVSFKWDLGTDQDLARYDLHIGTTAGFTPSIANRIFSGLADAFTYNTMTYTLQYFKLLAIDEYGQPSAPASASATPLSSFVVDETPPSVPTGLSVTTDRTGNVAKANLSWSFDANAAGNDDIQSFVIKWYKSGEPTKYSLEYADKASRTLSISLPQAYSDYVFQIASVDFVANYSAFSSAVTLSNAVPGPPNPITNLTGVTGMDSLTLNWTHSTSGDVINGGFYKVTIATNSGFTTGVLTYETGNPFLTVSGLASNTTYYYKVVATDSTTLDSTAVSGSAVTDAFPVPDPSDGVAPASSPTPNVTPGIGYLFLSWTPVANNDPVNYEIHVSITSGFTPGPGTKAGEIQGTVANLRTTAGGTPLVYGTTYYIKTIAKDADGAAAASAQGSGTPAKLTNSDSSLVITAADVQTGTLGASIITLGSGGIIQSSNWTGAADSPGFQLSQNSLIIRNGTISAGVLESGSSITANLNVTGNMTISSSGTIKSTNYVAGTSGFSLSASGLDVRSGTIAVGTLIGGTISSQSITLGAGAAMTVDSTAVIKSNNWSPGVSGWQLSATGLTVYGLNATLSATNVIGDTISGRSLTVSSGGYIQSSNFSTPSVTGWQIGPTGLTIYNGVIFGASIETNQIKSFGTSSLSTSGRKFAILSDGKAEFSDASIYGDTRLGSSSSNFVQSGTYTQGSVGWKLRGDGTADFTGLVVYGNTSVGASSSHYIQSTNFASNSAGWRIDGAGNVNFNQATITGGIFQTGVSNVGTLRIDGSGLKSYDSGGNNIVTIDGSTELQVRGTSRVLPHIGTGTGAFITNASVSATFNGTVSMTNGLTINGGLTVNTGNVTLSGSGATITVPSLGGTGGNSYVLVGNAGVLSRGAVASSLKVKENIREIGVSSKAILGLKPYRYSYIDAPGVERVGFIAEYADGLGLSDWVAYDDKKEPMGFDYPFFVVAQQVVLREHESRFEKMEKRVKTLEQTVQTLERLILSMLGS